MGYIINIGVEWKKVGRGKEEGSGGEESMVCCLRCGEGIDGIEDRKNDVEYEKEDLEFPQFETLCPKTGPVKGGEVEPDFVGKRRGGCRIRIDDGEVLNWKHLKKNNLRSEGKVVCFIFLLGINKIMGDGMFFNLESLK